MIKSLFEEFKLQPIFMYLTKLGRSKKALDGI